jgi:hypothetical protein
LDMSREQKETRCQVVSHEATPIAIQPGVSPTHKRRGSDLFGRLILSGGEAKGPRHSDVDGLDVWRYAEIVFAICRSILDMDKARHLVWIVAKIDLK